MKKANKLQKKKVTKKENSIVILFPLREEVILNTDGMQGKLFAQSYREFFEVAIKYMLERKTYKQKISFSFSLL
jgi:hypothetical protein